MHDPESYLRYRPRYPIELFERLAKALPSNSHVVDLGAGTGLSILSMLEAGMTGHFTAVEPDPGMVQEAERQLPLDRVQVLHASAESTGLPDSCADAITIASAYHWMDRPRVDAEMLRILKPQGRIQIFEYQFPKAEAHPELNEWIRRQFNTLWKFPDQKPRGRLADLAAPLARNSRFARCLEIEEFAPTSSAFHLKLTVSDLVGLIFSQARALSYLRTLPDSDTRLLHREAVAAQLTELWGQSEALSFRFKLAGVLLEPARL